MQITTILSKNSAFPVVLKTIYHPPKQLYLRGLLPDAPAVAVVGTRRMSEYGRQCVRLLVPEIVRLGITVVSGLALGIDGAAHEAALEAGGRTVAIIGSGVDDASIYPRAHLDLARRIIESGGAVLSEYAPGTPSLPHHFPERNRIIAGLSQAVLVIEAPRKSGAMITARLALEAGRDVWAVPGPITAPNSWGPNELIKNGATPIAGPADIAIALGLPEVPGTAAVPGTGLPPEERAILEFLRSGPKSADELSRAAGIAPARLGILLTELEIKGRISSLGAGRFSLYT